ncbi:hypothetical protein BJY01DRAFT_245061 [Aspergillus pseudoustus]|uniref:DUF7703 domain-containing protein n=1 Tax=Aspergillus pseudoustus TaxID=1810923 RepID=A0ABR4KFR6_9EURO
MISTSVDQAIDGPFIVATSLLSISLYIVLELLVGIFTTFKRRSGLYFYSCLISTIGLASFTATYYMRIFPGLPSLPVRILFSISSAIVVNAQHLVLYARLHVILPQHPRFHRAILIILIVSSLAFFCPQTYLEYYAGSTYMPSDQIKILAFNTVLTVREMLLCMIYLVQGIRQLKPIALIKGRAGRNIMVQLILVQAFAIILDIGVIVVLFKASAFTRTGYTTVVIGIKLRMECAILNALKKLLSSPVGLLPSSDEPNVHAPPSSPSPA